ncbi:hydroxyisourate hydrolase [Cribrihabitans neustonicus]|uniref:hydroxyisourate hydrolase n=1 Tax=Cribrihabitans neustonicus TaxID=1429085 RepID=UPI003B5B901C
MSYGIGESAAQPGVATPSLSIRALDLTRGLPAIGLGVEVLPDRDYSQFSIETNNDGRTDQPLLEGPPFPSGQCKLRFAIGKFFALNRSWPPNTSSEWLDIVPVQFDAAVEVRHLHVAMLMTPNSYTAYRGS